MPIGFIERINRDWKALVTIGVIVVSSVYGWNYTMAQAADVAQKEVQATINKEMIDGAKKAAADAVKEQLPAIARQVAAEVAKQVVEAQRAETKKGKKP